MKFRIPFHHDRISLNIKIAVLLVVTITISLMLAGKMVYSSMRDSTYTQYADALAQIATVGTIVFSVEDLKNIDKSEAALKRTKATLAKVWKQSRFDRADRLGRLSLVRLNKGQGFLEPLAWLGDKPAQVHQPPPAAWEAAARGLAVAQGAESIEDDWIKAWAPVPGTKVGSTVIMLQAEYSSSVLSYRLIKILGTIFLACLVGLLVSLGGAVIIANQVTKPLRAFADVMRLMSETDNYDIRIDLHPHDREMTIVERSFISLMKKVKDSRAQVEKSYLSTLQALVTALDIRDNETSGHSLRVMRYSTIIADRLRVSSKVKEETERGALLHDIGKIGVPDAILKKAGRLTSEEWVEMQKHPEIGKKLLSDIEFLEPAIPVVYCHHERWDGKGYPRALVGEQIPLPARIFMVADALDTITSERYYKRASSFEAARKEIERSAGSHFDPAVVQAFLTIPVKTLRRIRSESTVAKLEANSQFLTETGAVEVA